MERVSAKQFRKLRATLRTKDSEGVCPVRPESPAGTMRTGSPFESERFWSPRAGGVFAIPGAIPINRIQALDEGARKKISSWIWGKNDAFSLLRPGEEAEVPELTLAIIDEVTKKRPLPVEHRIERALRAIGRPPSSLPCIRRTSDTYMLFQAATECGEDRNEASWFQREIEDAGYATSVLRAGDKVSPRELVLTLKGLDRLETGGDALVSNTVFVAMWFGDEAKAAYDSGIDPAIRDAGCEPVRIDRKEHSDRIGDRIIAEIRRARFLVCDFTCGLLPDKRSRSGKTAIARGGVCHEAGFAHGLDKRVIWTCRQDLIDHVRFDVRQYNLISREPGQEADLRDRLATRVRAVIP